MIKKSGFLLIVLFLGTLISNIDVFAHGGSQGVIVRVTSYDPLNHIYNFSCIVPNKTAASNIGDLKFYDIDPTPSFYPSRYTLRSPDGNVTWHLDPVNFEEEVHTNAMYHIYCEVQNYSASPDNQNLASEFHVDLRTTHNQDDPNIYVLDSEGPRVTLKCDPPPGTKRYTISWGLRDRNGITPFPELVNKRIVNITAPMASAGWDITCDVFDKDKGQTFHWDMPVEFFETGPAYIPTIEGCVSHEPCPWVYGGIPPNGTLIINITLNSTPAVADVFINEKFSGKTNASGFLTIQNIIPGIYNLVVRKDGYNEISTLVPIASGKSLYRNYSISENVSIDAPAACYPTVFGIPTSCNGGAITSDDVASGCRQIICSNNTNNMRVLACNKPGNNNPQYFEMYKQSQSGTSVRQVCIGSTCITDSGFAKSLNFPICTGNATQQTLNGSLRVSTIPNFADVYLNGNFRGNSGLVGSLIVDNLIPTTYQLLVKKANYTDNISQVAILEGQLIDVQAKLSLNSPANSTNTTSNTSHDNATIITSCFLALKDIPSNCTGGYITQDTTTSGRTIICNNGTQMLRIQAWEKPDSGTKQYFEMYRQTSAIGIQICIGHTCISDSGYARSQNYPICVNKTIKVNNTINDTNTTPDTNTTQNLTVINSAPNTPIWLEPDSIYLVDAIDFHIQVYPMADADNDTHIASDFEIWDVALNQRVWNSLYNKFVKLHIHNADGSFENTLAGQNRLLYDSDYKVRAKFYTNSTMNNVSNWSEWRNFHTKALQNFSDSTFEWTAKTGYTVEVVAKDISVPVNVVIAPDLYQDIPFSQRPRLYFTQLYGQVGMIKNDGSYHIYADNLLNYETFGSLPGSGETGVDGIYADEITGDLFVSMVYADNTSSTGFKGKIVRFFTNSSGDGYSSSNMILSNIPVSPSHHVHLITRGPDGKLYMGVGDGDAPGDAPDPNSLSGKILRLNEDGSKPPDNPYNDTYVYASGFRNPFGTTWSPLNDKMYMTENGPNSNDALKIVTPGMDHGWGASRGGNATASNSIWVWNNTVAPVALAFDSGSSGFLHEDNGSLFVGLSGATYSPGQSSNAKRIVQFKLNPDGTVQSPPTDFVVYTGEGYSAPIGLAFGKEGLYFTDIFGESGFVGLGVTKGSILLVKPGNQSANMTNGTNETEEFFAGIGPQRWYPKGLEMVWVCRASGGSGNYTYDFFFGDGQKQTNMVSDNVYHKYPSDGTYNSSCTVNDIVTLLSASASTILILGEPQSSQNGSITLNSSPPFANVFLNNVLRGITNSLGRLSVTNLIPGNYDLKVNKTNYTSFSASVVLNSAQNLTINVTLDPVVVNDSNPPNQTNTTCHFLVQNIPSTCTATITQDNPGGCRTVTCASGPDSIQVMACDKPDTGVKQFFEIYRQSYSGIPPQLCIGNTCISNEGYKKSPNYPICI